MLLSPRPFGRGRRLSATEVVALGEVGDWVPLGGEAGAAAAAGAVSDVAVSSFVGVVVCVVLQSLGEVEF